MNNEKKLSVKADNILVENLDDKDKYNVFGGGIAMSGNVSVISGKKIRRQKTNATAVNTEFEIGGEKKSSKELGFKTNLSESQIVTKDENNLLDVDLHTDLLKEEKREEITQAGDKVSDMVQAITNPSKDAGVVNTYKENRAGRLFNDYVKNTNKSSIFTDTDISIDDKIKVLNNLYVNFLEERGYKKEEIPKVFVGEKTFAAKDGTIYISKEHLESGDALSIFAHEYGHLNSYDHGEETAINVGSKVDKIEINKTEENISKDTEKYLSTVREKEKDLPSVEEQIELSKIVPKDERENFVPLIAGAAIYINSLVTQPDFEMDMYEVSVSLENLKEDFSFSNGTIFALDVAGLVIPGVPSKGIKQTGKLIMNAAGDVFMMAANAKTFKVVKNAKLAKYIEKTGTVVKTLDEVGDVAKFGGKTADIAKNADIGVKAGKEGIAGASKNTINSAELMLKTKAADAWGIGADKTNQGVKHFNGYWNEYGKRIPSLADRLGMKTSDLANTTQGFENFTRAAQRVIQNYSLKRTIKGKTIYYVDGVNKVKKGVVVIVVDGKIQTMMPSSTKDFSKIK